jgi:hypothetical protein
MNDDTKLKGLIKDIRLEKPSANFTTNVMNRVFELKTATVQSIRVHILDWKFWVLVGLFVVFAGVMVYLSQSGVSAGNSIIPDDAAGKVGEQYRSALHLFDQVPLSIAAILTASSLLIFLERYLTRKKHG